MNDYDSDESASSHSSNGKGGQYDTDSDEALDDDLIPLSKDETSQIREKGNYPISKLLTTTCLHKYAIERVEGAQSGIFLWPPIMLDVIEYLNTDYKRKKLVTERNLAMVELMLDVPLWLCIPYKEGEISKELKLSKPGVLDYSGQSFVEAIEIVTDLLTEPEGNTKLKNSNLRLHAKLYLLGRH